MKLISILKPALFIYEVIKLIIFVIILIIEINYSSIFVMMFFAAHGIIFPLMALFLFLDAVRYKEYLPLFIAGKIAGIFILFGWLLFSEQSRIIGGVFNGMSLLSFELLALAAIFYIKTNIQIKEPSNEINITEE